MDLDELIRNIRRINITKEIESSIRKVKEEYKELITVQTCKIYSSLLYEELRSRHVPIRLISTGDLGLSYDHVFLLSNDSDIKYYLIDLTFNQFENNNFNELKENGYQEIDNSEINKYLEIVSNDYTDMDLDNLYYGNKDKKRNI